MSRPRYQGVPSTPNSPVTPTSPYTIRNSQYPASPNSPYGSVSSAASLLSFNDELSISSDPAAWGTNLLDSHKEADDYLHNPDPHRDQKNDRGGTLCTTRGIANLGCLFILFAGMAMLFGGYPILQHFTHKKQSDNGGFNLGGTNETGQVASMPGNWGLIDLDTPTDVYTKAGYYDGADMQLVFSDEFNTDGRTFYPGDDPYWEAVDLHYWETGNMEWYDPAAITTADGALTITLSEKQTHNLSYQGGMMSTWNKFCFTGGILEASVQLPGARNIAGLWPAVWAMGNLGRAGYGATLEGMWPYTYDSCDVGTAPNQTIKGLPVSATADGDAGTALSFLPGQRLSRCTCPGEVHPGPTHSDGSFVGRSAPEIDVFEATVFNDEGYVSQSGQWAPFNFEYTWLNSTDNYSITNDTITELNGYKGGVWQQATSALTRTNQSCYELEDGCFSVYGFEYRPGFDNGYISWISSGQLAWTLLSSGMATDTTVEIAARPIPQEPMYIIANLGMSAGFGAVDLEHLTFPTVMKIDYVRVYQRTDSVNVGCDPVDFPTAAYITQFTEAYNNPNLTTWKDYYGQPFPKNRLIDTC